MRNKKVISVIAIILAVLMVFSLVATVLPVIASAVSEDDVAEAQAKKEELAAQVADYDAKLEELQGQQASVMEQKDVLDARNNSLKEQISLTEQQIELYSQMVDEQQQVVDNAKALEEQQLSLYRQRVRAMEERGGYNILAIILNSSSLTELMTAIDDYGEIMQSDRELEDKYIAARENYETELATLENTKAEQEAVMAELEEEKADLTEKLNEVQELLDSLDNDIEKATAEQEKLQAEAEEAEAEWANLSAELNAQNAAIAAAKAAEEAAAAAAASSGGGTTTAVTESGSSSGSDSGVVSAGSAGVTGTGSLMWPVPSSYRVSSCFKMRNGRMHEGIDIDGYGLDGNAIVACDSGVVVAATYSGAYGNYVMIDHGNGMQTVLAHMASLTVSVGQTVNKGDQIGTLGRTGNATGTSTHLEVRINGSVVDPLGYFSGYTLEDGAADPS